MFERFKSAMQMVLAAVGVISILGTVAYQAGWIIPRAGAQAMIDSAVSLVATQAAQAVLDEAKAREQADLLFQKQPLVEKIKALLDIPNRSGSEQFELEQANKDLDRINARLDELD